MCPRQVSSANSFAGRTYPTATVRAAADNRRRSRAVPAVPHATRDLIVRTARRYGVDPGLALAVAWQESGWNQRQVSVADAIGAMQVVPATGRVGRRPGRPSARPAGPRRQRDRRRCGAARPAAAARTTAQAVAGYYQGLVSVRAHGMYADTAPTSAACSPCGPGSTEPPDRGGFTKPAEPRHSGDTPVPEVAPGRT